MKTITDERGGWTSASNAEADSLCPGRHLAQRGLPEEPKAEDAESGTRIHAWLEGAWTPGNAPKLTDDEHETADKCRQLEMELVPRVFGDIDGSKLVCMREHRMWLTFGVYKHCGKADTVYFFGDTALVLDYKTGRNEATESPKNLQLRDLAVLAASNHGFKHVHVAIIQPWATMKPEICSYTLTDLMLAADELRARVEASNDPEFRRIPGAVQCQYCRAKKTCPEFIGAVTLAPPNATPEAVQSCILSLPAPKLGKFLSLVRLAEETASGEVRRRIEAGEPVEGWALKPGRETEKIIDAQTVFTRAITMGITQQTFVADCITVGKTALKAALKTATETKGKALDAKLDELLAGATETKTSNPVLTKA